MKFNLYIQTYISSNTDRQKELSSCYISNLQSGLFDRIFLITSEDLGSEYPLSDITKVIKTDKCREYSEFFRVINENTGKDDINIIANSDIQFDETIRLCEQMDYFDSYALTRYENIDGNDILVDANCTQDVWIFKGSIRQINVNFQLGTLGCDNRLAYEIAKSGYRLTNPCLSIKTYHIHKSNFRTYHPHNRLCGKYLFIEHSYINNYKLSDKFKKITSAKVQSVYDSSYDNWSIIVDSNQHNSVLNKPIFKERAPLFQENGIIPFPIISKSDEYDTIPIKDRKYTLSCITTPNGNKSNRIVDTLNDYFKGRSDVRLEFRGKTKYKDKIDIIRKSKIYVCLPSEFSKETEDYTEAAKAGCVIVCSKLPQFWYYQNKYEFQIPHWSLLSQLLDRLLKINDEEFQSVSNYTREYYDKFLSTESLNNWIKYFIDRHNTIEQNKKKIISYSLWGNNPKYIKGAYENIELAKKWFPDWHIYLFLSNTTQFNYKSDNLTIIKREQKASHDGLFWRFEPVDSYDTVIIRDLDDRLSERHAFVVNEWLTSNKDLHIIRDHPNHTNKILGGLWGVRNGILKGFSNILINNIGANFGSDQDLLERILWNNKFICRAYIHDSYYRNIGIENAVNIPRNDYEFLGDTYDENNIRNPYYLELVKRYDNLRNNH